MQPLVLMSLSQWAWLFTLARGNSLFAGIFSIEYQ